MGSNFLILENCSAWDLPKMFINRKSERHLKDAWTVAIHTYGSEAPIVKAIEHAMEESE